METLPAVGRKRARPAAHDARSRLREDVLNLMRSTRAPLVARRRRIELAYDAAWRMFCRVMSVGDGGLGNEDVTSALSRLAHVSREDDTVGGILVRKIASSVVVSRGHARQQQLLLEWAWLGHTHTGDRGRLWEFSDVLTTVSSVGLHHTDGSVVSEWLCGAIHSLLTRHSEENLQGRTRLSSISRCVVEYLVRLAFSETMSDTSTSGFAIATHGASQHATLDAPSLAQSLLQSICRERYVTSHPVLLVGRVLRDRIQQHAGNNEALAAALRVFLRTETKEFVLATAGATAATDGAVDQLLQTLQSCVSAPDVVQLLCHVWTESKQRDVIDTLAPLVSSCAQRDHTFRAHALATAHDLANEAIAASDAALLGRSLDLAAASTMGPTDEDGNAADAGYGDWFKSHFAAAGASALSASSTMSDHARQSLSGDSVVGSGSSPRCLRSVPSPMPASPPVCGLVSTKRHLQFVCAFLLEWDRVASPSRRAHHVIAHLSAVKTHQTLSGSAVGGLLSDFCSQTRARVGQLEAQEREATAIVRRRRLSSMSSSSLKTTPGGSLSLPSQASLAASEYSLATRGAVEELLEMHRNDHASLGRRVNQYKMFEVVPWKQQVLPCCLDLAYWQETASNSLSGHEDDSQRVQQEQRKRTFDMVSLVQALAKFHAVGMQEYVAFLERVEAWFLTLKQPAGISIPRTSQGSNKQNVDALCEAAEAFSDTCRDLPSDDQLQRQCVRASWEGVTKSFVAAFEGLVYETPTDQLDHMRMIYELTVERLAGEAVARGISFDDAVELFQALWVALLSNETPQDEATPQDRLHIMEAYCKLASERATPASQTTLTADGRFVETTLLGCLLGLLGSVPVCEALARSASLTFCVALEPTTAEPSVDDLLGHLRRSTSFLSGFLAGFIYKPTEGAPQMLLQSMLTPPMRECLIWVGHHTSTWWRNSKSTDDASGDPLWPFVGRVLQSVQDQHGWFRLTFSPGVFTTKDQWQVFMAMELTCCVTQLLQRGAALDIVDFINRQHEQIRALMISSAGAQSAGVRVVDVCIWIVQTTLELSASSPRVDAFALDALVLLFKGVWSTQSVDDASRDSVSSVLGFLMEMTLQLVERVATQRRSIVKYAVRCAHIVVVEARRPSPLLADMSPVIIRQFVDQVARSAGSNVIPYEWVSVVWCIVLKLQHTNDVYAAAGEIPPDMFAHWAYEFPRLSRLLTVRKNGKVSHATNATLLRTVQTCFEFFRTLHVRRLAPAPSMSLFGVSASQYVPTSSADESLALHVQSLAWLIESNLIPTPAVDVGVTSAPPLDFETSLAFHELATRVLAALLEDVSIDRPEDVAVELTEICQTSWLASVSSECHEISLRYQLLLVHVVADLAARHASVARFLLRSSSELLQDARRSLFLLLVLTTSKEIEQIDILLKLNGSLWLNTFAEVACSLAEIDTVNSDGMVSLVRHSDGFESQLVAVLSRLLSFAAAKQIDLLDSSVISRLEKLFPALQDLLARVPVLNLASAALADW